MRRTETWRRCSAEASRVSAIPAAAFENYWNVGPQRGDLNTVQFVGKNSPNPDIALWNNDMNNFGPAVGFSWSVPWFGADKTTLRGGYGVTYVGTVGRASAIDAATGPSMPGVSHNATFTSTQYLDLTNAMLPVPRNKPLQPISVADRTQSVTVFDNNTVSPLCSDVQHGCHAKSSFEFEPGCPLRRNKRHQAVWIDSAKSAELS
jgi:hypothetical protein